MEDDEFLEDVNRLRKELKKWKMPQDERDEIEQESVLRYQRRRKDQNRVPVANRLGWLLRTASNVKRERDRQAKRLPCTHLKPGQDVPALSMKALQDGTPHRAFRPELNRAEAWRRLPPLRQRMLILVRGYETTVTDAARELGVARSTAKSWLERDQKKLALDPVIRRFAGIDSQDSAEEGK